MDFLEQETVSGSGIRLAIYKSAPCTRQITTPAPHYSVFLQASCPSCHPTNSVKALKALPDTQYYSYNHIMALWTLSRTTWASQYHLDFLVQNEDNTGRLTNNPDGLPPIQTNWCPNSASSTIFMPDSLPGTTLSIYPGLEQAPNMLTCIPGGLVHDTHMPTNILFQVISSRTPQKSILMSFMATGLLTMTVHDMAQIQCKTYSDVGISISATPSLHH